MTNNDNGPSSAEAGADLSTELTNGSEEQNTALQIARHLAENGIPIFVAKRDMQNGVWNPTGGHKGSGYWLPKGWNTFDAVHGQQGRLRSYRPGDALCALMGWGLDVVDIDPRNGGSDGRLGLPQDISVVASASTPNDGTHWFVRAMNVRSRDSVLPGIDVKAGTSTGQGRGFAWIAPTVRQNKVTGALVAYRWTRVPDLTQLSERHPVPESLRALVDAGRAPSDRPEWSGPRADDDVVLKRVHELAQRIENAGEGEGNTTLNEVAFKVGEYVGAGQIAMDTAFSILDEALDSWDFAAGDESAQRACLVRALEQGAGKPRAWTADVSIGGLEEWHPNTLPVAQNGAGSLFEDVGDGDDKTSAVDAPAGSEIGTDEPEVDDDSWQPINLADLDDEEELPPTLLPRSDGAICLLYPGLIHSIHGESESGKSWITQAETVRLIKLGHHVLFLDFENDAKAVRFRFRALGATREELKLIDYRNPDAKPQFGGKWWTHMFSGRYALIVLDGVTDALGVFSMGTKDNDEISTFLRRFPRALARRTGAAVVMIDHVTKDKDSRGRWALGGQAKMAGLDGAAYVVETKDEMGRGKVGTLLVKVAKDKPGFVRGATAHGAMDKNRLSSIATFVLDSSAKDDGSVVTARLDPPEGDPFGEAEEFDPGMIRAVLTALVSSPDGLSKTKLTEGKSPKGEKWVKGKAVAIRECLDEMAGDSLITISEGGPGKPTICMITDTGKDMINNA